MTLHRVLPLGNRTCDVMELQFTAQGEPSTEIGLFSQKSYRQYLCVRNYTSSIVTCVKLLAILSRRYQDQVPVSRHLYGAKMLFYGTFNRLQIIVQSRLVHPRSQY